MADEVLQQGVRGITDLMVMPGLINLDFADVRSVMSEMGKAMMGTGEARGDNRAIEAAEQAIANPLLDGVSHEGRQGRHHLDHRRRGHAPDGGRRGRQPYQELVDPDANIIWGSAFNNDLDGKIRVSVVATGIDAEEVTQATPQPAKVFAFPAARAAEPPGPRSRPSRACGRARAAPTSDAGAGITADAARAGRRGDGDGRGGRGAGQLHRRADARRRPSSPLRRPTRRKATSCCSTASTSTADEPPDGR